MLCNVNTRTDVEFSFNWIKGPSLVYGRDARRRAFAVGHRSIKQTVTPSRNYLSNLRHELRFGSATGADNIIDSHYLLIESTVPVDRSRFSVAIKVLWPSVAVQGSAILPLSLIHI